MRFDASRVGGAASGRPLPQQFHHFVAPDAIPLARFDPAQRDRGVEYDLQGVQVTVRPGAQPALDDIIGLVVGVAHGVSGAAVVAAAAIAVRSCSAGGRPLGPAGPG